MFYAGTYWKMFNKLVKNKKDTTLNFVATLSFWESAALVLYRLTAAFSD